VQLKVPFASVSFLRCMRRVVSSFLFYKAPFCVSFHAGGKDMPKVYYILLVLCTPVPVYPPEDPQMGVDLPWFWR